MRILVSGASGFLGTALTTALAADGHEIGRLVRRPAASAPGRFLWSPDSGVESPAALAGWDAVVHLAGRSVAGIWTAVRRREIRESRVKGTRWLAEALARADPPPRLLACASATGYYGGAGSALLEEDCPPGEGFLAAVCRDWEGAAEPAREAGIPVASLRLGIVLGTTGGALSKMLPPFRWGLGGRLGDGSQWMSWIALDDAISAIRHVIERRLEGPVNVVAPAPVPNREFTETLGRVLGRATPFPVPAFALRLLPGGMGRETLLASQRVVPRRLLEAGFEFRYPHLEEALRAILTPGTGPGPPSSAP